MNLDSSSSVSLCRVRLFTPALWSVWTFLVCGLLPGVMIAQEGPAGGKKKPSGKEAAKPVVLVQVNGKPITSDQLERMFATRRVPANARERLTEPFLEQMVDARLMKEFLQSKKVKAPERQLQQQIDQIKRAAAQEGEADEVLTRLGYTPDALREEFWLPLAWQAYVEQQYPADRLKEYFLAHKQEFDGTKLRASQIFIKVRTDQPSEELKFAEEQMQTLRMRILNKEISFEEAARQFSQSPSGNEGGDLGEFMYTGRMPESFSKVAFGLKVGELSQPFRTRGGVHLCVVMDRIQGDLNLEDVRKEMLARITQEEWNRKTAELRKAAQIEWMISRGEKAGQ